MESNISNISFGTSLNGLHQLVSSISSSRYNVPLVEVIQYECVSSSVIPGCRYAWTALMMGVELMKVGLI